MRSLTLAVSWLLVQIVETLFPVFGLSNEMIRLVVIVLAIGFPLILIFSWLYELTPEGLKKEKDVDHSSSKAHHTGKQLDRAIIIILALSLGYLAFDKDAQSYLDLSAVFGFMGSHDLGIGVNNVFDKEPPLVGPSIDARGYYDPLGLLRLHNLR